MSVQPLGGGAAFMLIFLPHSLPAFILAREGRPLARAALLAGLLAFAYFDFWFQALEEFGIQRAP